MKYNEMQEHLISILDEYTIRTDLVNKYIINPDTFIFIEDDEINDNVKWEYYMWVCRELKINNRIMRSSGIDSKGGRKMKIEGHLNEELVSKDILENDTLRVLITNGEEILNIICDGIKSKKVESILYRKKTTPKCDIKVITNKRVIKLSVKKSEKGQVHLNKVHSFIDGYEQMFETIPDIVKESLLFLFSGHKNTLSILNDPNYYNRLTNNLEKNHETLTIDTMNKYNPELSKELLQWFKSNIANVTKIVFKTGWAEDTDEWCDFIYYKNIVNKIDYIDDIIDINKLIENCNKQVDEIKFGVENGGTTINLPFGSVQYHLGGLQFHHNRKKIMKLIE